MSGMFDQYNLPGDTEDATDDEAYPDPRPPKEEHSGQVRMPYRLAKAYTNRLLYVHGIGWFYWDRKRWAFRRLRVREACRA